MSETQRWAEDFEKGFLRVLVLDLQRRTGADQVRTYPWLPSRKIDYAVEIAVLRFEADSLGTVDLWAKWILRDWETREVVLRNESRITQRSSSTSTSAVVGAHSEAVVMLSREIAAALP